MQMKSLHYGIFASITLSLLLFSTFSIAITDNIGLNVMTTVVETELVKAKSATGVG